MDEVRERIRAKHAKLQEKKREYISEHKEAVANGTKKLTAERTPDGLYTVRFIGGGGLPDELKGRFTSIRIIQNLAEKRYGAGILA